ncbi:MAG: hypothetical protein A3I44_01085 [Candidatus Sungbacteria bacterium RIFCSPLOWO2_02_FULL_51_17]|uniref:Uncharacterized protein n=1 Tax=Candidatus Sungbacteria bacterium RIFCSPHIGHO2_02_FULL_51_29 TaxID=1802273 RepID=A0A1G2KWX2_9BACT|nr:MAG: hypothetical protein A2676_03070 [Candidatus Sungbacteria bacterium RIFCSPHIGHO2_01_FULL_51_22]OHA03923.1 MAG: hypothetical protein A3C16_03870 [Candidatus Sungbacteria bacterium RIFCSPHIGHO2_02_FULL_51_29]OHA12329.1 MAG: hypothetical protein A3I44_01085 [Candidatus Sungbacteria bacterium RIFCSPLOWO2_02_FULL_51_17]
MPTFGDLRLRIIRRSRAKDHFEFIALSDVHRDFWNKMNAVEYRRGYRPGEYERPGSPALCEMELLTKEEMRGWMEEFESFHTKK